MFSHPFSNISPLEIDPEFDSENLVGLTCILDGSGSMLWEFSIFAMESSASLESLESWHPWNPRTLWTLDSLASLESLEILEIW